MAAGICRIGREITSNVGTVWWRSFGSFGLNNSRDQDYYLDNTYYDWDIAKNDSKSFSDLHVHTDVSKILKTQLNISVPTEVQRKCLPLTMIRKTCLIQSPTGSGKTLCYLLPAIQDKSPGISTLVLVPTRELAQQVYHCASILGTRKHNKSKNLHLLVTGHSEVEDPLESEGYDKCFDSDAESANSANIVIGTPKRILEEIEKKTLDCQYLRRIVMDECDKLLLSGEKKSGWRKRMIRIRHPRPTTDILLAVQEQLEGRPPPQLICTSATAECGVEQDLARIGWKKRMKNIICSTTRQIPDSIHHSYTSLQSDSDQSEDPVEVLAKLIKQAGESSSLLFIHRGGSVDRFVRQLRTSGVRTVALYEKSLEPEEFTDFLDLYRTGEIQLAVSTEESVRGLDFPWVSTVYLTEVPRNVEEYVHLCGRVGRLNQEGRAVVLVSNPRKDLPRLLRFYQKLGVNGSEICLPKSTEEQE